MAVPPPRLTGRDRLRRRRWWFLSMLAGVPLWRELPDIVHRAPPGRPTPPPCLPPQRTVVRGAVHVHTTYSDGAGDPPVIIEAARQAGVDFVVIADHEGMGALRDGWEGYHDGVLVLVGNELRSRDGYVLALDLPPTVDCLRGPANMLLGSVRRAGGTPFLALVGDPYLGWADCNPRGVAGLEVINLGSIARRRACPTRIAAFAACYALGLRAAAMRLFIGWPHRELQVWDELLRAGPAAGIASVDAHASTRLGTLDVAAPSYQDSFRLVQTHLLLRQPLTGDATADRRAVLSALSDGRCHAVFEGLHPASGYRCWAQNAGGSATAGERLPANGQTLLRVAGTPNNAIHRLVRDGVTLATAEGPRAEFRIHEPGAYRVETALAGRRIGRLRLGVLPWVFANPIYLD